MKFARTGSVLFVVALFAACGGSKNGSGFGDDSNGNGNGGGDGGGGNGSGQLGGGGGDGGAGSGVCAPNPANYEIPGNGCDDDDDGTVDNVPTCDTGLSPAGAAGDFVKAMGICQMADATHWGLVSASYTNGYGSTTTPEPTQHSIQPGFGTAITPQEGASLGILSTGYATNYDNASNSTSHGQFKNNSAGYGEGGSVPSGYPKAAAGCPDVTKDDPEDKSTWTNDVVDVKLQLKVPANAQGISFDFDFYSGEWPDFVCSDFNDSFIAYLSSSAFNGGTPDNISFDSLNNPVSVNNGFFDRCTPGASLGCAGTVEAAKSVCAGGEGELAGTGFLDPKGTYGDCKSSGTAGVSSSAAGGATGWLTSQAPVKGGETITIEFMIWNTGDEAYDSSVLLDHLTWVPGAVVANTNRPR
jgi:hypothetical protein